MMRSLTFAAVIATAACRSANPPGPEEAYQGFIDALRRNEVNRAFAYLSKDTRALATKRAAALRAATRGAVEENPAEILLQSGIRPELESAKMVESDGGRALLFVTISTGQHRVALVKEDGTWKVDFTPAFAEFPIRE